MIPRTPDGLLLVDKPAGMTSHDVVLAARRATGEPRIGHTGTLDPFATGLLVLLVGRATRLLTHLQAEPKVYDATIAFGTETDTEDPGGNVVREAPLPARDAVLAEARTMTGDLMQVPSTFSAKRVGGRRAYAVARRGEDPGLQPVRVHVSAWESLRWHGDETAVEAWDARITCSGGTYVRALARDLGRAARSAAHVRALRRCRVGSFDVGDAVSVRDLLQNGARLLPPEAGVAHLPRVELDQSDIGKIARGIGIPAGADAPWVSLVAADSGMLVAIAERKAGHWQPRVVMRPANDDPAATSSDT